jgi:hypothetical protein
MWLIKETPNTMGGDDGIQMLSPDRKAFICNEI